MKGLLRNWLTSCLAASQSNLIGCRRQTVLNLKNLCFYVFIYVFCQAWPEDYLCQGWRLIKDCDRRCIFKVFDKNQDGRKSIMAENDDRGALNSAWPKDSNDTLFVNSG